jgi:hypothetical protein
MIAASRRHSFCEEHRVMFLKKGMAIQFVKKFSQLFDSVWKCPCCNFWIASDWRDVPPDQLSQSVGIFYKEEERP